MEHDSDKDSLPTRIEEYKDFEKICMNIHKDTLEKLCNSYKTDPSQANLDEFDKYIRNLYTKLESSSDKLAIRFFPFVPEALRKVMIRVAEEESIAQWMEWEYEAMFLGNPKQMLVYKKHRPLMRYLRRYRLPKNYNEKTKQLQDEIQACDKLLKQCNEFFSEDKDQEMQQWKGKISLIKITIEERKYEFFEIVDKILKDYKVQPKRTKVSFRSLRLELRQRMLEKIESMGLFPESRECGKNFCEIDVYKEKRADIPEDIDCIYELSTEDIETTRASNSNFNKADSDDEAEPSQPNKIKNYQLSKIGYGLAIVRFQKPFDNLKPILRFRVYKLENGYLVHQKSVEHTDHEKMECQVSLEGLGYCQFVIKAENQIGVALQYEILRVFIPNRKDMSIYFAGLRDTALLPEGRSEEEPAQDEHSVENEVQDPVLIKGIPCCSVSVRNAALASDESGTMAIWGNVYISQDQEKKVVTEPTSPVALFLEFVTKVSCGRDYYLVLDAKGSAYGFGYNKYCQLGLGYDPAVDHRTHYEPEEIEYFRKHKKFIVDIVASEKHSLALDSQGEVYSWGYNQVPTTPLTIKDSFGSIINYTTNAQNQYKQPEPKPLNLQRLGIGKADKIRAGYDYSAILTRNGELYMWGDNTSGQLGVGQLVNNHEKITNIILPKKNQTFDGEKLKIVDLAAGGQHCIAIAESVYDRKVYGWGSCEAGECGHALSKSVYYYPRQIQSLYGHKAERVWATQSCSVVKTNKGLYSMGLKLIGLEMLFQGSLGSQSCSKISQLEYDWWDKVEEVASDGLGSVMFLVDTHSSTSN